MAKINVVTPNCKRYHSETISGADGVTSVPDEISFACSDYEPKNRETVDNTARIVITNRLAMAGYCRGKCSNNSCERLRV